MLVSITTVKDRVKFMKLKVELSIDVDGIVVHYKIKKRPRKLKNAEALEQMISQMKFLPSTKNNKPVSTKTTASIKFFEYTQVYEFYICGIEHLYLLKPPNNQWVRVAVYINKKGKVMKSKAIGSSNIQCETEAVNAIKKQI